MDAKLLLGILILSLFTCVAVAWEHADSEDITYHPVAEQDITDRAFTVVANIDGTSRNRSAPIERFPSRRTDRTSDNDDMSASLPAAGPPGAGMPDTEAPIPFEHVPVSEHERDDRGIEVYRLAGSNQVRVEVYMGEQPTTGYDATITTVTRNGESVTVHAVFTHPPPNGSVTSEETYPADAVEFTLPDGKYDITASIMEFDHEQTGFSLSL